MGRVNMPITKLVSYFLSLLFLRKKIHDCVWAKWRFTIFLGTPKTKEQQQRSKKRMSLFKERKKYLDPLIFKSHFFSFLVCFEQFKKLWKHHLKFYKTFLKCKNNRMMSKDLKLHNTNWSYVPTQMPTTPFTWKKHILFIPWSIWVIFVALDAQGEGLKNLLKLQRKKIDVQRFITLCP